jgi:hypothetical protein
MFFSDNESAQHCKMMLLHITYSEVAQKIKPYCIGDPHLFF